MKKQNIDTLVISDLHLGSKLCKSKEIIKVIEKYKFNRLLILGDGFDSPHILRLKKNHFEVLEKINKLTSPKKKTEVIWIKGNHDIALMNFLNILGVNNYEEYFFEINGKKFFATHGHLFDIYIRHLPNITHLVNNMYYFIQKLYFKNVKISNFIEKCFKKVFNIDPAKAATEYIQSKFEKKEHVILLGHSHIAKDEIENGFRVLNAGCFTGDETSYITINFEGEPTLIREYEI